MSHQNELYEQVKTMLSTKYFTNSPDVRELESGDILVTTSVNIVTDAHNRRMELAAQLHCKDRGIVTRAVLKMKAPAHAYQRVVELITQINQRKPFSCFEFDYRDGEIAARNFLRCNDYVPSVSLVYSLLGDATSNFMDYGEQLLEAMGVDENTLPIVDESNALDVLDEALKGDETAQTLLVQIINRDPSSFYYPRLKEAAEKGNNLARALLRQCGGSQSSFEEALVDAEKGNAEAQYYVGVCFQTGKDGAPVDPRQATKWLEAAANAGNADALCYLGLRIFAENGHYGSEEDGVRYLSSAAQKGHAVAQFHMAEFYWDGVHVRQDKDQAIMWYEKSAQQNHEDAQMKLGLIYHDDEETYRDAKKSAFWLERAAKQGNVLAQRQTAVNYLMGNGVDEDNQKFKYWLEKAARQRDEKAISVLRQYCPDSPVLAEIDRRSQPQPTPQPDYSSSSGSSRKSGGGCYIATCVYGSYDCPPVWTLRRYRDDFLAQHTLGKWFICCYYAVSPYLVEIFGGCSAFRTFWKKVLDKMVASLNEKGYQNTPYED